MLCLYYYIIRFPIPIVLCLYCYIIRFPIPIDTVGSDFPGDDLPVFLLLLLLLRHCQVSWLRFQKFELESIAYAIILF